MFDYGEGIVVTTADSFKLWPTEGEFTALLDADLLPYIVGYSRDPITEVLARSAVESGDYLSIQDTPQFQEAAEHLNCMINDWVTKSGADSAWLYVTHSPNNYRLKVAFTKPYKGQRKQEKPPFFYELKQYLIDKHNAVVADGMEADDLIVCGMWEELRELATEGAELGSQTHKHFARRIAVSTDKDIRICPGWHYDPGKDHKLWVEPFGDLTAEYKQGANGPLISKLRGSGLKFFYAQLLMGDQVDNYPGVPRVGPSKTYDLLHPCSTEQELFDTVLAEFARHYGEAKSRPNYRGGALRLGPLEMMVEQGRLAWMRTYPGELWMRDVLLPSGEDYAWQTS